MDEIDRLARQFHDMLALYSWLGCGWLFDSKSGDGSPLCPCRGIATKYLEQQRLPDLPADSAPGEFTEAYGR